MPRSALLAFLVFMLAACAGAPVSWDHDPAAPLPALDSYALVEPPTGSQFQSLDNNRIAAALRTQLAARSLKEAPREQAGFWLAYRVENERKLDNSGVSFGFGLGTGNVGMGVSTGPKAKEVLEGRLVLDVIDPARQQVIWTAKANQYLQDSMTPAQRDAKVNFLVTEMLSNFPPKPAH